MAKGNETKKEKKSFIWIIAIVLCLIVLVGLAVVILSLIGYDVKGWAKDKASTTPVIATFVNTDEEDRLLEQLSRANETISSQKEKMADLEQEIASLEGIVEDQELDITRLENRHESSEELEGENGPVNEVKQAAASFRKMDAKKAAGIVQNMDKSTAINVLSELSGDVRGGILAEMEPKSAAELMEGMLQ